MAAYSVAKHGIIGLLRVLRVKALREFPELHIHAICPSFTDRHMTAGIKDLWVKAGVPTHPPEAIAKIKLGLAAAGWGRMRTRPACTPTWPSAPWTGTTRSHDGPRPVCP